MKTAEVETVFARLRDVLVPLIAAVGEHEPVDDSCLRGRFPVEASAAVRARRDAAWGMDDRSWRLDDTVHPFAVSLSPADIRLTTNIADSDLSGLLSCLHEFGHGLYERQVDPAYFRTPLANGVSSAFHESQSRLWENLVGRNLATWRHFYPRPRRDVPAPFGTCRSRRSTAR